MSKDFVELRARQWLEDEEGYTDILDLSNDNLDPPDFVVKGRIGKKCIGVEVRRLNRESDSPKGLETIEFNLTRMINEVLKKAGETPGGYTVYVKCETQGVSLETRQDKKEVKRLVVQLVAQYAKQIDTALKLNERPEPWRTGWERGIQLRFFPGRYSNTAKFKLEPVQADVAMGFLVVRNLIDNILRCIKDKTCKIQGKIDRYDELWLVLVDLHIMMPPGLNRDEWEQIRNGLGDTKPWSRIVVINNLMCADLIGQPSQD